MKYCASLLFAIFAFLAVFNFEHVQAAKLPKAVALALEELEVQKTEENVSSEEESDNKVLADLGEKEENKEQDRDENVSDEDNDDDDDDGWNIERKYDEISEAKTENEDEKTAIKQSKNEKFDGHDLMANLFDEGGDSSDSTD